MAEEDKTKSLVSSILASTSGKKAPAHSTASTPELPMGDEGEGGPPSAAASALVTSVLGKLGISAAAAAEEAAQQAAEVPVAAEPVDPTAEAETLIEVYFDLEEPTERDALFDQIVAFKVPVVDEFLRSMMLEDEDEFVRAAAAAEMARRGDADALARLEADLVDPDEPTFFEQALLVLGEIRGPAFYDTAAALWRDPERDGDQRREAMLAMETVDAPRALADFSQLVETTLDIRAMPDDQIEVAMMAFVRHAYDAARRPLAALRDRIAATDLDAEERQELVDFIQEGIDLLGGD